jgi:hypothetical protein
LTRGTVAGHTRAVTKRTETLAFRCEPELREKIRAHAERLRATAPNLRVAEADAVRDLVVRGLEAVKEVQRPKAKTRRQ